MSLLRQLVYQFHQSGRKVVIATSGGGASAIAALLRVPGGSRSVLEAVVPYSEAALNHWLGGKPDRYCSPFTATAMAMAAFWRARELSGNEGESCDGDPNSIGHLIGLACTASLATDRPKRGDHRIYVAAQTVQSTSVNSLVLVKGARTRSAEEAVATRLLLQTLADSCQLAIRLPMPLLPEEIIETTTVVAPIEWQQLLAGSRQRIFWTKNAATTAPDESEFTKAVLPGSFNPIHHGHERMVEISQQLLGCPVALELSILNADKPPLDFLQLYERLEKIKFPIWLTRAPTFAEKVKLFPAATFVVGIDTLIRIGDPRYYHNDPTLRDRAIATIAEQGCRFLVFGRQMGGRFTTLENADIPSLLRQLCTQVPENIFREDISSTEIRRREACEN